MYPFVTPPRDASLAERLGTYVMGVIRMVGDRTKRAPSEWHPHHQLISMPMAMLIQDWLQNRRQRIVALMARIAAGTHRAPLPYRPRTAVADTARAPRSMPPPERRLPRRFAWLCGMATEVRNYGGSIARLLDDPEMKPMVLASAQMVRLWNPLLNALAEPRPDWMPVLPKRGRTSRGGSSPSPTLAEGRVGKRRHRRYSRIPGEPSASPLPHLDAVRGASPQEEARRTGPPPSAPSIPAPNIAPWTGRGPGPCATLAEYRSPFEPPGADHPPRPPAPDRQGDLPISRRGR